MLNERYQLIFSVATHLDVVESAIRTFIITLGLEIHDAIEHEFSSPLQLHPENFTNLVSGPTSLPNLGVKTLLLFLRHSVV